MFYQKIKKITLPLLSLLFVFNHSAKAQQGFRTGIMFGPAVTNVNGMDDRDFDNDAYKLGFSLGAFANTQISEKNILQFEINFTQKGSSQPPDSLNQNSFKLSLNYLDAGVLIRHRIHFKLSGKPIDKVDFEFGVSGGRLLGAKYILNTEPVPLGTDNFNYTDFNAFAGIDYNFTQNIYFGVRYTNSLESVLERNTVVYYPSAYTWNRGHNQVFDFSLHIIFGKRNPDAANNPTQTL